MRIRILVILAALLSPTGFLRVAQAQVVNTSPGKVYVFLWFDTADYILPQSDDAAKRLAVFLTQQDIRATFKVAGEKARVLEQRGRRDVIGALAQHEIGYLSNTYSQHPTPAEYEAPLGWQGGVDEFDRRERPGFNDVRRILGQTPTCFGQPGSSWVPQSYAALRKWGVKVYLAEGRHLGVNGKPFWYGGLLNIFNIAEGSKIRPSDDDWSRLAEARARFQESYLRMTSRPEGGVISLHFRPCEFIQKEFWDEVNFARGASPTREAWIMPPMKSPEESERAFKSFEELIVAMKSFPRVEFLTASQALLLFRDTAQRRSFEPKELAPISRQVGPEVSYQVHDNYSLTASEVFFLLNRYVAGVLEKSSDPILLDGTPEGPASASPPLHEAIDVPWRRFARTVLDVEDYVEENDRLPGEVWLGSTPVPPESYLVALAQVTTRLLVRAEPPVSVTIPPASLSPVQYVTQDDPQLWDWSILPQGFRAPQLMTLAKLQAWTLKPARSLVPTP